MIISIIKYICALSWKKIGVTKVLIKSKIYHLFSNILTQLYLKKRDLSIDILFIHFWHWKGDKNKKYQKYFWFIHEFRQFFAITVFFLGGDT
ncbi:hypothetical protein TTHERM_000197988 (macronuclear) [Tetrahymena thermophila SB210]|uniref:Uncharacterized protein n=1 Tax=Tetrahymena thermophila (strain SB210) TaxID=312017 RepID=W7XHC7_TETTS|nr:hypothetical protein TTHERM_000197988 [Tetrahymena thermophila SB210]EWS76623.1 hypothetical protein TTHERM_000197988 [Tetrahymena thermophila SB210]|eukprot:XP_012650791.1 hypothetical protein TTHERM_000197988 [Tetrahymena thermophila SB210]